MKGLLTALVLGSDHALLVKGIYSDCDQCELGSHVLPRSPL